MSQDNARQFAKDMISKDKWWEMLSRFVDVLRINIFIVDAKGAIVLPAEEGKYGGQLLINKGLGFDLEKKLKDVPAHFTLADNYYEAKNAYDLYCYAIPVITHENQTIAYTIIGPVILNKRLKSEDYQRIAQERNVNPAELLDQMNEVRVVSNIMMNSIINLLMEIVRDNIELSRRVSPSDKAPIDNQTLSEEQKTAASEIYSTVRLDELLVTLLDVALKMTETEMGSIMVVDQENKAMTIKVSRGIEADSLKNVRVKVGEGIAGIAAQENAPFLIQGQKADNRIKHLLKRPQLKEALVMPLVTQNRVFGVLNLSTKREESKIAENLENLTYLSKFLSSVI